MIYRFYDGVPDNTLKYVETILPLIGNIKEFEVFKNLEDTPYVVQENEEKKRYTFILKDEDDNEFWLYTLCGYHGSGSYGTLKILQLLGLKEDFEVCEERNIHIEKKNLNAIHRLNLLIVQDKAKGYDDKVIKHNFVISIDFGYAYQKQGVMNLLNSIGHMNHVLRNERKFYEKSYVFNKLETPEYEYYYYTNHIFTLNRDLRAFSREQVQTLLTTIIENNGGTIIYKEIL